jgi:pyruvate carboxylase
MRVIENEGRPRRRRLEWPSARPGRLRQRRGLSRKAGAPRPPRRGADPGRHARQPGAPVRARLLGAAPQPEGGRARAGALSGRRRPPRTLRGGAEAGRAVNYTHAGTVEFLMDADTGKFYFIEVNPRIQVEHTVTEHGHRHRHRQGADPHHRRRRIGDERAPCPAAGHPLNGHALQCRSPPKTRKTASPRLRPDAAYRSAAGFGIRLDGGTAYSGAVITPYYDSLLVKVTAWAPTPAGSHPAHGPRAARVPHPRRGDQPAVPRERHQPSAFAPATVHHALHRRTRPSCSSSRAPRPRDALLRFLGDVAVNGNPEMKGREALPALPLPPSLAPSRPATSAIPAGTRDRLKELGRGEVRAVDARREAACCSPTRRCATRTSRSSPRACAPRHARASRRTTRAWLPGLFSMECWGGATFDVALRFLKEDPWERLARLRAAMPNVLFQMLLRASNAVGYTNYPTTSCATSCSRPRRRHRPLPRLRLAELGRQHARGDRRRARDRRALRGRHLLHRRPVRHRRGRSTA